MSVLRFFAIVLIFGAVSMGWLVLGGTMWLRTEMLDERLSGEMKSLWGPKVLEQTAPYWAPSPDAGRDEGRVLAPSASTITAKIRHEHRYKGLLWYSTFTVDFEATYTFGRGEEGGAAQAASASPQAADAGQTGLFVFDLPKDVNGYDSLSVTVDGREQAIGQVQIAAGRIQVPLSLAAPGSARAKGGYAVAKPGEVRVTYTTNAQDVWLYSPGPEGYTQVRERDGRRVVSSGGKLAQLSDFRLTVQTDFDDIDYPAGTRSPNEPAAGDDHGRTARWEFQRALTNQAMGIAMPKRPNAGPIAVRMSLFAPVSLFFFFTVLFTVVVLKRIPLHPMHYLFVAAGFFAFHVLLAYLVDRIPIHAAFWICAGVAVFLVLSYMRLVAGVKFAVVYVGTAQLVYLLGFSYAFFFPGWTGLTVVIGAVVTLFVLMQATGRVNWFDVFRRPVSHAGALLGRAPAGPPPAPPATPPACPQTPPGPRDPQGGIDQPNEGPQE